MRKSYSFLIDTDRYSGNFEREMLYFVTGQQNCPDGATGMNYEDYSKPAVIAAIEAGVDFEELLEYRLHQSDDIPEDTCVTIAPTPGFFNDGKGNHYKDTPANRKKAKLWQNTPWPAYQSVQFFLSRKPTLKEIDFMKKQALAFAAAPKINSWDSRPKILGFRLVTEATKEESESV